MKKIVALLLSAALLASAMVGCTPAGPAASAHTISVVIASEPATLDPALNQSSDGGSLLYHLFEGLYKLDENGGIILGAAKDGAASADGMSWTFHLRDGLKWSDGTDVTAEDFVYSWQRLANPLNAAPYGNLVFPMKNGEKLLTSVPNEEGTEFTAKDGTVMKLDELGAKAIDAKTIQIEMEYSCPYFTSLLAFPVMMPVCKAVVEKNPDWTQDPKTYVGNGPMKLTEWNHKQSIVMMKNENYYDKDKITNNPLKWNLMDDNNAMYAAYQNGEIDYLYGIPIDEIKVLRGDNHPEFQIVPNFGTYYVDLNNQKEPFKDPNVRKALSLVIDRNYIANTIKGDGCLPTSIFSAPGLSGPTADSKFNDGLEQYISIDPADYDKNVAEAQKLLADAGFPGGKGFPDFEYMSNTDSGHVAIFEYLQSVWSEKLGIKCHLSSNEWSVLLDMRNKGEYVASRDGWLGDWNDPSTFFEIFTTGNGNNNAKYSNAKYDELWEQTNLEQDPAKRFELFHQMQNLLLGEDSAIIPLYNYVDPIMVKPQLKGYHNIAMGYKFFMNATWDETVK